MTAEPRLAMSKQSYLLTRAAASEAMRAGRAEVDVEHVLLALLTSGGPSAGHLLRAGADVVGLRLAAADLEAEDLAPLVDPRLLTPPGPGAAARAADEPPARSVPVNARVRAVLEGVPMRADETSLLLALLADSPRAGRLLHQQGVDVPALRAGLITPQEGSRAGAATESDDEPELPAPPGWTWQHAEHRQVLPVSAAEVWALVSDPARRPQWDATCAAVDVAPDGSEHLVTHAAGQDRVDRQVATHLVPGRAITWARHPDPEDALARAGAPAVRTTTLRLADQHPEGAVLNLRTAWLIPSRRRWLRRPLTRMWRTQLRLLAQGIAQSAPGAVSQTPPERGAGKEDDVAPGPLRR